MWACRCACCVNTTHKPRINVKLQLSDKITNYISNSVRLKWVQTQWIFPTAFAFTDMRLSQNLVNVVQKMLQCSEVRVLCVLFPLPSHHRDQNRNLCIWLLVCIIRIVHSSINKQLLKINFSQNTMNLLSITRVATRFDS